MYNFVTDLEDSRIINENDIDEIITELIPTTNTGKILFDDIKGIPIDHRVNDCDTLNQYCSICSQPRYHIKSYQSQIYFLQRILSSLICESIPPLYSNIMIFHQ